MGHESVVVERPCPDCGAPAQVVIGASFTEGELRCFESLRCPSCSCAQEACGRELYDYIRNALCAVHGRWSAHIRGLGPDRLGALFVLRSQLGLTPVEALHVVRDARPIVNGALVEIEHLRAILEPAGIQLAIVRLPD
jgi:hypothetical protein